MTTEQFLYKVERLIYKDNFKNINLLLGNKKSSATSAGIFLKLPIEFSLHQSTDVEPFPKKVADHTVKSIFSRLSAYVKLKDCTTVFISFIYTDESELDSIFSAIERNTSLFAIIYLHELFHIVFKHITPTYDRLMTNILVTANSKYPKEFHHDLINRAEDYFINYVIKDIVKSTSTDKSSHLHSSLTSFLQLGLYDKTYHENRLSDQDILKKLANSPQSQISTQPIPGTPFQISTDGNGNSIIQPIEPDTSKADEPSNSGTNSISESQMSALSESLQTELDSASRGNSSNKIFSDAFASIKVNTDWFKKIKASFKRQVYYMTHDFYTKWSSLNNKYRHIYKSPKKIFLDDKISIILANDQSGSVADADLQKLLYLIESESKRITSLTVLIHDTEIVKQFDITSDFDISTNTDFDKALRHRNACGGTSHKCIVDWLDEHKPEPSKTIVLIFSDMQSDIPHAVKRSSYINKLNTFWVHSSGYNDMKKAGIKGTHIYLE